MRLIGTPLLPVQSQRLYVIEISHDVQHLMTLATMLVVSYKGLDPLPFFLYIYDRNGRHLVECSYGQWYLRIELGMVIGLTEARIPSTRWIFPRWLPDIIFGIIPEEVVGLSDVNWVCDKTTVSGSKTPYHRISWRRQAKIQQAVFFMKSGESSCKEAYYVCDQS